MSFVHLHTHSHYSLLDGLAKIDGLIGRAQELKMNSLALTDHGNLYGAVEFYQKAKKAGIKPILGVEAYVCPRSRFDKQPKIDDKPFHLVLLARDQTGWLNLLQLVTKSHLEGFYYKPRMDKELLRQHSAGLIALSACAAGEIPRLIEADKIEMAKEKIREYQNIFGSENFFLEIGHHPGLKNNEKTNKILIAFSREMNAPLVATQDIHYLKSEDMPYHEILLAVQTGHKVNDSDRLSLKEDDFSMRSSEEMANFFQETPEAIENTLKIAERCNLDLDLNKVLLPHFSLAEGQNANSFLSELVNEKLPQRFSEITPIITERIKTELAVIEKTGFADYFLIVRDIIDWARARGIVVGPGRGSAAGSLVSYVLGITNIDPLKYDLIFERFLTADRVQMPDIDIDFTDVRRDEVMAFVREKYGADHVAQIITFGTMAARAAVRDAGRALGMPYSFCDQTAKLIGFNLGLEKALDTVAELRKLYEQNPDAKKLIDSAKKLEGVARHASVHACGVVISKEPLTQYLPLQNAPQGKNIIITQFEMHTVETLGLLKMDFLGLRNLTIIEEALKLIKDIHQNEIDINKIPLDDKETFALLQSGETTGIFQLECLSGETIISNTTIKNFCARKNKKILSSVFLDEGKVHKNQVIDVLESGEKDVYTLITENNWYIKSTKNHYFLTPDGWKKLEEIKYGEKILIKIKAKHLIYNVCKICGKQINGQKKRKSNFCYKCSAKFYSNPSKKKLREKIRKSKKRFYQQGGKPWNFGITTENNELWQKTAQKISKALQGKTWKDIYGPAKAAEIKKRYSKRFRGTGNPMFGKPSPHRKGGFREDLGHYVRSNWEADFARILKFCNLDYEYEPKTFRLIQPTTGRILNYTPDFFVKSKNTFYEIKGWFHDLDKEKVNLFQKQYPQYNFVLINSTRFAEFALKFRDLIKWECPRIPSEKQFKFIKVKEIKYGGREKTYDIIMKSPGNNFIANGFLVHNSGGMRGYLKQLKPTEIEDVIAMVSLYRPGPMELIPQYIRRKHGLEKIVYLHPKLESILAKTYGVVVYQEQLMKIAQELAGFSLTEADVLRKAVGKKIKALLQAQAEKMVSGMVKNGIEEKTAKKIWEWFEPFASYGFNKSHGTCYALIGYQTAYLKAHFPVEFYTSLFNSSSDDIERIAFLVQEARRVGISVLPPDINQSQTDFAPEDSKNIRFGLLAIKNLGANIVSIIIEERGRGGPFENLSDLLNRVNHRDLNKKSLESLIKSGCFDSLGVERQTALDNIEEILKFNTASKKSKLNNQYNLFGLQPSFATLNLKPTAPTDAKIKLVWERELLGLYLSDHPLKKYLPKLRENQVRTIKEILSSNYRDRERLKIAGVIASIQKFITKTGQPMLFVKVEDLTDSLEVLVFSEVFSRNPYLWKENNIIMVNGQISLRNSEPKIICQEARELC